MSPPRASSPGAATDADAPGTQPDGPATPRAAPGRRRTARGESPGGIAPPGARRTVRERLRSYSSHHPAASVFERLRVARRLLPHARLTVGTRRMTRPLCSIEFPRLHRSYGSLCPCASHRASHPWGSAPWISPFTSRRQVPTFHTRAWCRVTPPLCRVPPSQAAGSHWTRPGLTTRPGFDTVPTLSTRCRWFIHFVSLHPT